MQRGFDLPKHKIIKGPYPVIFSNGIGGYHTEYKANGPGVVTGRSGSIGNVSFIKDNYWPHNTSLWVTNLFDNYPKYVFYLYQRLNLAQFSTGSGVPTLNRNIVHNQSVAMPKFEEQNRISTLLEKIDNIITLEQEKLAHYQAMKKALSTSIFPRNNESLPNLTFNGDSGWKQQKLENFLSIPDKIKVEVTDTDEILSVKLNTNGVVGGESRSTLKLGATTYYRRYSGQFIYGKQNFFNGAMAIVPESLDGKVSSGDIPSLNISGINPQFLYEYLSRPYYYKQTETMASGTGSKRIHEKTLLTFKIKVPNSNVQSNIEYLLASLSNLIDIQNNKVKKVEQAKAYLLNNLFV